MNTEERIAALIESVGNDRYPPGLSRMRALMHALGDPQKKLRFVHVAGTNGKGTVCACLASVLQAAGYRTGLYTSPHIFSYCERMRVNGAAVAPEELLALLEEMQPVIAAQKEHPSVFETVTAAAFCWFVRQECDVVVLEVGLGGRWDATNVIDEPECAVIVPIGLDHTALLGTTVAAIAGEKSGVIKPGCRVVNGSGTIEAEAVIEAACRACGASCVKPDASRVSDLRYSLIGTELTLAPYGKLTLPLLGTYQKDNMLLAVTALEALPHFPVSREAILAGLAAVRWPGRFELLHRAPDWILDGAHNAHGVRAAAESLRTYFPGKKIVFVMGVMADKDVDDMMAQLIPLAAAFVTVSNRSARAMSAEALSERAKRASVPACPCETVAEAVRTAAALAGSESVICSLGSLYLSGSYRTEVAAYFTEKENA